MGDADPVGGGARGGLAKLPARGFEALVAAQVLTCGAAAGRGGARCAPARRRKGLPLPRDAPAAPRSSRRPPQPRGLPLPGSVASSAQPKDTSRAHRTGTGTPMTPDGSACRRAGEGRWSRDGGFVRTSPRRTAHPLGLSALDPPHSRPLRPWFSRCPSRSPRTPEPSLPCFRERGPLGRVS